MDSQRDNTPVGDGARRPEEDEPAVFVGRLLDRAENVPGPGGSAPDPGPGEASLARLRTALMHTTQLHSMRQRNVSPRAVGHRTLKHVFLLADGAAAVLWEVEHNAGDDDRRRFRLYEDQAAAESFVRERFGEPPVLDLWPRSPGGDEAPGGEACADADAWPAPETAAGPAAGSDPDTAPGAAAVLDPRIDSCSELGRMIEGLFPAERRRQGDRDRRARRAYEVDGSAEHARRVLRRAENADRPGETIRHLLRLAVGHETTLVTLRHETSGGSVLEWALYRHAFLLSDGAEVSLWELEHTDTPNGWPVCEVYLDETVARDAVERGRAGRQDGC